jgi:Xaa-Pro dipeptidase
MAKQIAPELSFPRSEYEQRLDRARARMDERGVDVLLVHHFPDVCYLSGYHTLFLNGYASFVLPMTWEPSLIIWENEAANADLTSWVERIAGYRTGGDPIALTADVLAGQGLASATVAVQQATTFLPVRDYLSLVEALPEATFVDGSDLVPPVKLIKSSREIDYIRRAAQITAKGMAAALEAAKPGVTDNAIAAAAYEALIAGGSEFMAMDPVVSAGVRAGIHHCNHRRSEIHEGDTVLLEMGAAVHRYSGPMMRSLVLGEPPETVKRMAEACKEALNAVIAAMEPGVTFALVAAAGKSGILRAGPEMEFHHTYGYSIGLGFPPTWADCPVTIREEDATLLEPGMVFHHTMSLRDVGEYGVALSETVAITEDGCEVLTDFPRKLFVK